MVERVFNMAASNTLSTVNGHVEQRRAGGAAGPISSINNAVLMSFQCQSHGEVLHQDSARLHGQGDCDESNSNNISSRQCRVEFLSAKDASRRRRVRFSGSLMNFCRRGF